MQLEILDAKAEKFKDNQTLQLKYLDNLTGCIGGFLSNNKPNADKFLQKLQHKLGEEFTQGHGIFLNKKNPSFPAKSEIIEQISQQCDFAVCAMGD